MSKKIKQLGEMLMRKRYGIGDPILTFQGAVSYIKSRYYDYDVVEFLYDGEPFRLEMKFTLTSQKTLL